MRKTKCFVSKSNETYIYLAINAKRNTCKLLTMITVTVFGNKIRFPENGHKVADNSRSKYEKNVRQKESH